MTEPRTEALIDRVERLRAGWDYHFEGAVSETADTRKAEWLNEARVVLDDVRAALRSSGGEMPPASCDCPEERLSQRVVHGSLGSEATCARCGREFPAVAPVETPPASAPQETLREALHQLRIDANRLCDRQLGGSYEDDCRRSIARADAALALAGETPAPPPWLSVSEAPLWQPLQSDMTRALIYSPLIGVAMGRVGQNDGIVFTGADGVSTPGGGPNALGVTHFMPLPAPPAPPAPAVEEK